MIITCQNCQTHYSLDTNAIGGGKTVRCSNCGNTWHQNPVQPAMAPPPPMAPPPMAPQQPFYAEQAPYPQPAAYPPPPPPPPMPEPPPPMPEPEPAPMPEPEPEPEPDAMPEPMPDPDAMPEQETAEDAEPDAEESASPASDSGAMDDALSPEQLDEMFGEETETDSAFQSLGDDAPADDEEGESVDPENIPDPEPIPQVFSADDDEEEDSAAAPGKAKGGKGKIIAIAAVVVFLLLGGGLFFAKGAIVGFWPGAAGLYAMVGLGGDELGAGLAIRNIKSSHEEDGGVEVLVVRGVVANVSEEDRPVPMIRVTLMDATDNEVQFVDAAPLKSRLPPGATIGFKAQIAQPSALARRVVVTFSEGEKAGG